MTDHRRCLHCDETKASLKSQRITMCAIEGGYEYREIEEEWSQHRWRDWTDRELDRMGVRPEAYENHRRTRVRHLEWVGCEDTKRGHVPATSPRDQEDFGARIGQCIACGKKPDDEIRCDYCSDSLPSVAHRSHIPTTPDLQRLGFAADKTVCPECVDRVRAEHTNRSL